MATPVEAYYGIQVTLADTNTHNLFDLLVAIDSSLAGVVQNCQTLKIQADDSNLATGVLIGDKNVGPTRYGYRILNHEQVPYSLAGIPEGVPLKAIYLQAEAATCKLNIELTF